MGKGELVVTDTRVLFASPEKSLALPLADIVNVTRYTDGFAIGTDTRTHTFRCDDESSRLRFGVVLHKVMSL